MTTMEERLLLWKMEKGKLDENQLTPSPKVRLSQSCKENVVFDFGNRLSSQKKSKAQHQSKHPREPSKALKNTSSHHNSCVGNTIQKDMGDSRTPNASDECTPKVGNKFQSLSSETNTPTHSETKQRLSHKKRAMRRSSGFHDVAAFRREVEEENTIVPRIEEEATETTSIKGDQLTAMTESGADVMAAVVFEAESMTIEGSDGNESSTNSVDDNADNSEISVASSANSCSGGQCSEIKQQPQEAAPNNIDCFAALHAKLDLILENQNKVGNEEAPVTDDGKSIVKRKRGGDKDQVSALQFENAVLVQKLKEQKKKYSRKKKQRQDEHEEEILELQTKLQDTQTKLSSTVQILKAYQEQLNQFKTQLGQK